MLKSLMERCGGTQDLIEMYQEEIERLKEERRRFLCIAYNAIVLDGLDQRYDEEILLKELGCTKEEYDEIMN